VVNVEIKVIATGSEGNCCWVRTNGGTFLLDAGIPIKKLKGRMWF